MADPVDLKDFIAGFLLEADEHLHLVNRNLVDTSEALKKNLPEPRAIRSMFRSIHTIKGLASMVGAEPIVDIAHEMESILRLADRSGGKISDRSLNLLLKGTKAIEENVTALSKAGIHGLQPASRALLEALALEANQTNQIHPVSESHLQIPEEIAKNLSASDKEQISQAVKARKKVRILEFRPSAEKAREGFTITSVRDYVSRSGELVKVIPKTSPDAPTGISFILILVSEESPEQLSAQTSIPESAMTEITLTEGSITEESTNPVYEPETETEDAWTPGDHTSIRVDVRRLDDALERLSELVVTRYKMARAVAKLTEQGVDTRELNAVIADHSRQLKRLRTAITESRMVPLSELLQRIPLIVRGLTKDSGKNINVLIQASSAEVDKTVADRIFPAIIHLIRNAVDHAIETMSEREQKGKPAEGTLIVMCDDSSGTSLVLTVKDDGRGIDKESVARKAGKTVAKTDEELLNQISIPGLSTRDNVSHTSGRGMGMDIVKKTIELLGGIFSMKTAVGEGTSFTLKVPVSVTIIDVFSFECNQQKFVAPIAMIDEIIELNKTEIKKSPVPSNKGLQPRLIQHREQTIPLFALDTVLNRKEDTGFSPSKALIVQKGSGSIAFGVDRMLGQQEVVVRPLDDKLFRSPGLSGATDLGDGLPTLVLDLSTLGTEIMRKAEATI